MDFCFYVIFLVVIDLLLLPVSVLTVDEDENENAFTYLQITGDVCSKKQAYEKLRVI